MTTASDRARRRLPPAFAAGALLVLVTGGPVGASSVGAPTGPPYLDAEACVIPWLASGESVVIEGITVRAVTNEADYVGLDPSEGEYLHEAVDVGQPTRSSTRLTFSPAVAELEVLVAELVPIPPNTSESYRFVGSPESGPDVLDWTLTDTDVVASGTFVPGIATLDIGYQPSISPDGAFYGAIVRLRIPRIGEDCEIEDPPSRRVPSRGDAEDPGLPIPVAVPSGGEPSGRGGPAWLRTSGVATGVTLLVLLALGRSTTERPRLGST
jgi:hypothetical protein